MHSRVPYGHPPLCLLAMGLAAGWILPSGAAAATFQTLPARSEDTPGFSYTASPPDWRDVPIYQVMTDRFFDGDPANNDDNPDADVNPFGPLSIHGGDFEGIEQKLEYIRMLGARAIWISPVVRNVNGIFHGFAAQDFNQIDPHWGTLGDLRRLADAAHARGLYMIIDVVQNHAGDLLTSTDYGYPGFNANGYTLRWRNGFVRHAPPFDDVARFHNYGNIQSWSDPTQVLLGDFAGLDGLRTEDPQVRQDLTTMYQALIAATDCDGFRVDTARHVEMDFWETFLPSLYSFAGDLGKTNFLVYCEAWLGSDAEVGAFTATNRFHSALHFPLRDTMENVFVRGQNTSQISDRLDGLGSYDALARDRLVTFLDNHDLPRVLSADHLDGRQDRLQVALTFLYTLGQVPCLYYGTEQGFDGGSDPFDREDMHDGEFEYGPSLGDNFDYTHPLFRHVRKLNLLRRAYPSLARGAFAQRWQDYSGDGLYVYSRILGPEEVVVALNTDPFTQTALYESIGPETGYPPGTVLVNVFDPGDTLIVGNGGGPGRITFSVPGYGYKLYVPQDAVQPLPATVLECTPGHDTGEVPLLAEVSLRFDQPMNTLATSAAFEVVPPVAGTITWQDGDTLLVFSPSSPFASDTVHVITLAATAESAGGLALGAAFQSRFGTGIDLQQEKPLGDFLLDGLLDEGAQLVAENHGMSLYVAYDATYGALYVAVPDAGEGNDHFVFLDDDLSGAPQPIPLWNKNGTVVPDGPFLADENDNDFVSWSRVNASAAAKTGPNGGVLEGVINLVEQYGSAPEHLYLAAGVYPSADGGTLLADYQVPPSRNFDQNIDSNECARLTPATGHIELPPGVVNPQEVALNQYLVDGQLSPTEQETLRLDNGQLGLYLDFNGKILYAATEDAGEGSDHFILLSDDVSAPGGAPWAKAGSVSGLKHFLADENDGDFEGWFINNQYDPDQPAATPIINGGLLEGTLDPVAVFGRIPSRLYVAVVPYATPDGGALVGSAQLPAGNGNGDVESSEYYVLDLAQFDTDGDGLPDLEEDLNANGVMDPGETGARVIDSDGDGMPDGDEAVAGSDGTDPASRFEGRIVPSLGTGSYLPRVEWTGQPGRLYSVVHRDAGRGGDSDWGPTEVVDRPGTAGTMTYTASNAPALEGGRLYRVSVQLAE